MKRHATANPSGHNSGRTETAVFGTLMAAFLGGSPLGGLASGWLITRVGSAPVMLVVNGTSLTLVALYFLIDGQGLKEI